MATKQLSPQEAAVAASKKKAERNAAKVANFKKLATKRVNNAIKTIGLIGNLANTGSYTYTPDQVAKITAAIKTASDSLAAKFASPSAAAASTFEV